MFCDRNPERPQCIGGEVKVLFRSVAEIEKSGVLSELRCKLLDDGFLEFVMRPGRKFD